MTLVPERTVNRYYDPTTDQFLSIDPALMVTDQPYVFTNDDPLNATDPSGTDVMNPGVDEGEDEEAISGLGGEVHEGGAGAMPNSATRTSSFLLEAEALQGGTWTLDALSGSGESEIGSGNFTQAGRIYQKADETGKGIVPTVKGPSSEINEAGQTYLDDVLTNPNTEWKAIKGGNFKGGRYYISPNGSGVAFDANGTPVYFGTFKYVPQNR